MHESKRIIIDGTVGAAKTTCILGVSTANRKSVRQPCLEDLGYPVTGEAIRTAIANISSKGQNPFGDLDIFFDLALDISADMHKKAEKNDITFFERGIPYLRLLADYFGYTIGRKYYEYCEKFKYDSPVFIFKPILSFDMTVPAYGEPPEKIFTLKQRLIQHQDVIKIYSELGYEIIEIPVFTEKNIAENNNLRIAMIKEHLRL